MSSQLKSDMKGSHPQISTKRCQVEHCPHWAFPNDLCSNHAALKLLACTTSGETSTSMQPNVQLYRKPIDTTSASRAHYDAVLCGIDQVLSAHNSPRQTIDVPVRTAEPLGDAAPAARRMQLLRPLTRSVVARWAAPHEALQLLALPNQPFTITNYFHLCPSNLTYFFA